MNTEKIAFDIISLAGDAKAELQAALKLAHQGKFTEAQAQIDKATPQLQKAHELQTQELLTREANGEKLSFNVLKMGSSIFILKGFISSKVEAKFILYLVRLALKISNASLTL